MKKYWLLPMLLPLAACAGMDSPQGDPRDYYADHPIKNTVEARHASAPLHFAGDVLAQGETLSLHAALQGISPPAVDTIQVEMSSGDLKNSSRKSSIEEALKDLGYPSSKMSFVASSAMVRGRANVVVDYLAVVSPDCPNWSNSPVTTYSNTWQGNSRCAQETNIGLMIADPHDLVRGETGTTLDTARSAHVLQDYRSGKDYMPATLNAGGTQGTGSNSSSSSGAASAASGSTSGGQ